jgi:transcriptional regulator with XRE-family HTH domain
MGLKGSGPGRWRVLREVAEELWADPVMESALVERDVGVVLRLVRERVGWSQSVIASRTGVPQSEVSLIMAGKARVVALSRFEALAEGLGMPDRARMMLGLAPRWAQGDELDDQSGCTCGDSGADERTCTVHRRQFLSTTGSALGTAWLNDPSEVARLIRRRAGSNVDEGDLDDLELTVEHLTHRVPLDSHHELFPLAARNWAMAEGLLEGWHPLGQRRRLVAVTGQLAYYVGRLHYSAGRYPQAWQFATLTQRYAAETGDLVLRHSAAGLQHSIAFYGGNHHRALDITQRADSFATDYTRARGLAKAARAHSALGDRDAALTALREMRTAVVDRPVQAGDDPFTEASALLHTTVCLQLLGAGTEAVAAGRDALAAFDAGHSSSQEEHTHGRIALGLALTAGERPDPDEAAALGHAVLTSPGLTATVVKRLGGLRDALHPWARDPQVALFADRVAARERLTRA